LPPVGLYFDIRGVPKRGVGVAKVLISGDLGLFGGVGVPFPPPPQPEKGGSGVWNRSGNKCRNPFPLQAHRTGARRSRYRLFIICRL